MKRQAWPRPSKSELILTPVAIALVIVAMATNIEAEQLIAIVASLYLFYEALVWIGLISHMARDPYLGWLIRSAERSQAAFKEESLRFERRAQILRQAKEFGSSWEYVAMRPGEKGFVARLYLPGRGWMKWMFAPITIPVYIIAFLIAIVPRLSTWESFHADDGYAEPPGSIVRILTHWRQIPPQNVSGTLFLGYVVPFVLILVFEDPLSSAGNSPAAQSHPAILAVGVLAWALLLTLTGELDMSIRGKARMTVWLAGLAVWIWASYSVHNRSQVEAFVLGARFTIFTDFAGLFVLMWLVAMRELPEKGEWRKRKKPA